MTTLADRLKEIADDPTWSPIHRVEAREAAHFGDLAVNNLDDASIRDALTDRIIRRLANRPNGPGMTREETVAALRERGWIQ